MGGDWFLSLFRKRGPDPERIRCFLAKKGHRSLKARTLGRVTVSTEEGLVFRSRRFFFGPWRSVRLPNKGELHLTNGTLFPLVQTEGEGEPTETLLHLLPRYRHRSDEVAALLGIGARETLALRGIGAARRWLREAVKPGGSGISIGETAGGEETGR